jgi:hypothetical protein
MSSVLIQAKADENKKKIEEQLANREKRKNARRNRQRVPKNNEETPTLIPQLDPRIDDEIEQKKIELIELERQLEVQNNNLNTKKEQTIQLDNKINNLKRKQKTLLHDYNKKFNDFNKKEESLINNIFNLERKNIEMTNTQKDINLTLDKLRRNVGHYTSLLEDKKERYDEEVKKHNDIEKSIKDEISYLTNKKYKLQTDIGELEQDYSNIKGSKSTMINKINQLSRELDELNENIENREKIYRELTNVVETNYLETVKGLEEQYNAKIEKRKDELIKTEENIVAEIAKMSSNLEIKKSENKNLINDINKKHDEILTQIKTEQSRKINEINNAHSKQQQELENQFTRLKREYETKETQLKNDVDQRRLRRKKKMDTILNNNSKSIQTDTVKVITTNIESHEIQVGVPHSNFDEKDTQCNLINDFERDVILKQQMINNRSLSFSSENGSLKSLSLTPMPENISEILSERGSSIDEFISNVDNIPETFENVPEIFNELYKEQMSKISSTQMTDEKQNVLNQLYELKKTKPITITKSTPNFKPTLAPKKEMSRKNKSIERKERVEIPVEETFQELDLGIIDYFNNELNKTIKAVDYKKTKINKKNISYISSTNIEISSVFYYSINYKFYDNFHNTFNIYYNFDKDKSNLFHLNLFTNDGGIKKMIDLKIQKEYNIKVSIIDNKLKVVFNNIEVYNKPFPYSFKYIESNTSYYIQNFL